MFFKLIVLGSLILAPVDLMGQQKAVPQQQKDVIAASEELEAVIAEAGKLDDALATINVRSRAAMLMSFSDPVRSEDMFLEVWKFANQQTDKDFDKEQALDLILKYLFPRNPKLAKRLLAEQPKADESSLQSRATGRDRNLRRLAKLASQLVDTDPSAASAMLEQSLSTGVTPAGLGALLRLREKSSLLSDFVAAKAMEALRIQPTVVSLPGLNLLTAYLFPGPDAAISSIETESSLQSLQFQYFSITYDVLKASFLETEASLLKDQHYTQGDLRFRAMCQGQVAVILAALAPRFKPSLSQELNGLARTLAVELPPGIAQLSQFTAARLSGSQSLSKNPEAAIQMAISNGDFEEAGQLIDELKNEELKKTYSQVLVRLQARTFLANSQVLEALVMMRKIEDANSRIAFYIDAVRVAKKKGDPLLSNIVVNEARTLIPQTDRNGLHVRALLSFSSQLAVMGSKDEAVHFLDTAVVAINSLPKKSDDPGVTKSSTELAMDEVNDPRSLLDAQELEHAFASMGALDLDQAIAEARKIEIRPIQMVATLEAIEHVFRNAARKPKREVGVKKAVLQNPK
jgi:hypothetical protein